MTYSNIGYGLLGHILGLAAGRPYEELVVDRVCRPLGLKDTTPDVPDPARAARGHRPDGRPVPPFRIPTLGAAGALRSTAVDMLAFLRAHLHPARTPFPEVVRLAIGPHRTFRRGRVGIGLGWLHLIRRDGAAIWHNGGTMGFGSFAAFDPGRDAAMVLLFNSRYLLRTARTALGLLGSLGE
jgi:CubicO group peptidase (beta-lactamase class C family)